MNPPNAISKNAAPTRCPLWKKLGAAGFLFFLIKGLLWLSAPFIIYWVS